MSLRLSHYGGIDKGPVTAVLQCARPGLDVNMQQDRAFKGCLGKQFAQQEIRQLGPDSPGRTCRQPQMHQVQVLLLNHAAVTE